MMRSLFTGVAGLRTHQTKMDVIGNNIANVNTTAYKSMSVTFRDLMYQTTQAASGPNAESGVGGINARQIGLGVKVGAINTAITQQGAAQTTNNPFDIMITGEAFFVVSNGSEQFYTRDGSFYVDAVGNLAMTSTGYNVMGWGLKTGGDDAEGGAATEGTGDENIIDQGAELQPLKVMSEEFMTYAPEATTEARVSGIIDENDPRVNSTSGRIMNLEFYDNRGHNYTAKFSIHSAGAEGSFYIALDDIMDAEGNSLDPAIMAGVTFGQTMEVATAIPYSFVNAQSKQIGTANYTLADGTQMQSAINTELAPPDQNLLTTVFGIDPTVAGQITSASIDTKGNLVNVVAAAGSSAKAAYAPTTGVTTTIAVTGIEVTKADGTTVTLTPGTYAPGAAAPSDADVLELYGLDLAGEQVTEYTINDDGSLTVTRKNVENAAALQYSPATGQFETVAGNGQGFITLGLAGAHEQFQDIRMDFSNTRNINNNGASTLSAVRGTEAGAGTGRMEGEMIGLSIAQDGVITASYDNGMSRVLGQIATAVFSNASGLEKEGDNLYSDTPNSGEAQLVDIVATGTGYMQSGVLEMSNVDLSQEFTEMITTQRGFQANSRIITVSDTLLEELTNLKR